MAIAKPKIKAKVEKEKESIGDTIYKKIKKKLNCVPSTHCPKVINMFHEGKGVSEFCIEMGISRQRFAGWQMSNNDFKEAVQIAKEIGVLIWLREGKENIDNPDFSTRMWQSFGRKNFGSLDKVSLFVDPKSNPIEQYNQIMEQASNGDFTSAEIKQIMESINIGLRAHEVCNLQAEVDELKDGLKQMEERELEYQVANQRPKKEDKAPLDS